MKTTILRTARTLCATVLVLACAVSAYADGQTAAKEKSYSGNLVSIDAANGVIKVQKYLFHKSFVLGHDCALTLGDQSSASLGDFRPGQKVSVSYVDAHGVLVADRVAQENMLFIGQVRDLDPVARSITVWNLGGSKTFALAKHCSVVLHKDAKGRLADVKLGDRVTVVYETPDDRLMAREIERKSITFAGTLNSIDYAAHAVTVGEKGRGGKLFRLSDDCAIMVNGKPEGSLDNLQAGKRYDLSYDTVNGVNVVNRIALARLQGATEISQRR